MKAHFSFPMYTDTVFVVQKVNERQILCMYTRSSQKSFFSLCSSLSPFQGLGNLIIAIICPMVFNNVTEKNKFNFEWVNCSHHLIIFNSHNRFNLLVRTKYKNYSVSFKFMSNQNTMLMIER